ncbi:MAG TPA: pyridoxamine 5'-phosphate oxidase family protein [Acidimicrobiia bacterium]|nr:pyridoxamine 5'-phosphate oxidase family protein [Acidimicrobiia bacterium]
MPPIRERPRAPDGYGFSTSPEGMLDWPRVSQALANAEVYWLGTVRPGGGPHMTSIWGAWVGEHLYFEGGDDTRWARNLAADPRLSFGAVSAGLHISGRGVIEKAAAGEAFSAVADCYGAKYSYRPEQDLFSVLLPEVVIALDMSSMDSFASSPTRFRWAS